MKLTVTRYTENEWSEVWGEGDEIYGFVPMPSDVVVEEIFGVRLENEDGSGEMFFVVRATDGKFFSPWTLKELLGYLAD